MIAIQNKFKGGDVFYFRQREKEKIQKEIHKLNNNNNNNNDNNNKAFHHSDISTKISTICT